MKPRHARQIRYGILAARQVGSVDFLPLLSLADLGTQAFEREVAKIGQRKQEAINAALRAAETFTHPTTPTAADKAAKPSPRTQKEQS